MWRKFTTKIDLLLFLVMFFINGCWWAGSGTYHRALKTIPCDKPWVIRIQYKKDPNNWRINLSEKAESYQVYYRLITSGEYVAVPMTVESIEPKLGTANLKAEMPSVPCGNIGEYLEYYYCSMTSDSAYNEPRIFKAVVVGEN